MTWQSITTAPRDGTTILAREGEGQPVTVSWTELWYDAEAENDDGTLRKIRKMTLAHWSPMGPQFKPTQWRAM